VLTFEAATRTELFEILEENPWFELIGIIRVVRPNWKYPDGDTSFVPGTWLSPDLFCEHADVPRCEMPASDGTLCIREAEHEVETEDGRRIPLCVICYMRIQDLIHRNRWPVRHPRGTSTLRRSRAVTAWSNEERF